MKVFVRVRPRQSFDRDAGGRDGADAGTIACPADGTTLVVTEGAGVGVGGPRSFGGPSKSFAFDGVLSSTASQHRMRRAVPCRFCSKVTLLLLELDQARLLPSMLALPLPLLF